MDRLAAGRRRLRLECVAGGERADEPEDHHRAEQGQGRCRAPGRPVFRAGAPSLSVLPSSRSSIFPLSAPPRRKTFHLQSAPHFTLTKRQNPGYIPIQTLTLWKSIPFEPLL